VLGQHAHIHGQGSQGQAAHLRLRQLARLSQQMDDDGAVQAGTYAVGQVLLIVQDGCHGHIGVDCHRLGHQTGDRFQPRQHILRRRAVFDQATERPAAGRRH
jgi:hypothetical protein